MTVCVCSKYLFIYFQKIYIFQRFFSYFQNIYTDLDAVIPKLDKYKHFSYSFLYLQNKIVNYVTHPAQRTTQRKNCNPYNRGNKPLMNSKKIKKIKNGSKFKKFITTKTQKGFPTAHRGRPNIIAPYIALEP